MVERVTLPQFLIQDPLAKGRSPPSLGILSLSVHTSLSRLGARKINRETVVDLKCQSCCILTVLLSPSRVGVVFFRQVPVHMPVHTA